MAIVKWDIKEIMSQHSQYVDSLLKVSLSELVCDVHKCVSARYLSTCLQTNVWFIRNLWQEFADFGDKITKIERYVYKANIESCAYMMGSKDTWGKSWENARKFSLHKFFKDTKCNRKQSQTFRAVKRFCFIAFNVY